ncbi:MAG: PIN domain-containing protein [Nanoarchaeota archaeon]
MKIILDTNFLVYCAKEKLDYNEEIQNLINEDYELVVPEQVINELIKIKNKKNDKVYLYKRKPKFKKTTGRDKEAASLSLQILDKNINDNKIKKIKSSGKNVDDILISLANENPKNIVCTLDRGIRKKLGRFILINKFKRLVLTR